VGAKSKGITGDVLLSLNRMGKQENVSLVDGRDWLLYPGLHWEKQKQKDSRMMVADTKQGSALKVLYPQCGTRRYLIHQHTIRPSKDCFLK
jgi:hypothetical protein